MKSEKADSWKTKDLLQYGVDHLLSAKKLLQEHPRYFDSAGYLLHLGFELLLKACILEHEKQFNHKHDPLSLYEDLGESFLIAEDIKTLELINGFYNLRYPNPKKNPEIGNDDLENIERLFYAIYENMPDKLQKRNTRTRHRRRSDQRRTNIDMERERLKIPPYRHFSQPFFLALKSVFSRRMM